MAMLATALAAHPRTPAPVLAALAEQVLAGPRPRSTTLAVNLWAHPATPEPVAAALAGRARNMAGMFHAPVAPRVTDTPVDRIRALLHDARPDHLHVTATRCGGHPAFARIALDALVDAGELTLDTATQLVTRPDLAPAQLRPVVHTILTSDPELPTLEEAITTATRVLPGELSGLAAVARHCDTATALTRYAGAPRPHELRLADLRGRAMTGDQAAAVALVTDPATTPARAAELLPRLHGAGQDPQLLCEVVLDTPHLAGTPAAWTALGMDLRPRAKGSPVKVVPTAEDVLTGGPHRHRYTEWVAEQVLPHVTDPGVLHDWVTDPERGGSPAAYTAALTHPHATAATRTHAYARLDAAGHPVHPTWLRLGQDPTALTGCPLPLLEARFLLPAVLTALTPVLGVLADPAVATAFTALEPTFTGTLAELVTTARTITA